MRSRASLDGHPIHPMLVPFPFAFLTGAFMFDALARWLGNMDLAYTGRSLTVAGIAFGLAAAVPGAVDYLKTVPPRSSAKTRATKHAILNVTALVVFAVSYLARDDGQATLATLGLQAVGLGLMGTAGYMGGTLVYRNQIGVDHRYAGAGKWRESEVRRSGGPVAVAGAGELNVDQLQLVRVNGARVALGRTADGFRAVDDRCSHKGGPLSDGVLICGVVQCPWHGSQFDMTTGEVRCGPATERIATHRLEVKGDRVSLLP